MDRNAEIRAAQERVIAVFQQKPQAALSTVKGNGRIEDGLACTFRQGRHEAIMDMGKVLGGDEKGPTPGFFIRAGLAGCIAIGVKLTATREGMPIDAVEVGVEMDFDDGALLGVGKNSAAPLATRVTIAVQSQVPLDRVTAMIDRALAADPYYLALRDAQNVTARVVAKE
ncbi:MAG: OsmC family protein [Parvibaculaceae bacterium]